MRQYFIKITVVNFFLSILRNFAKVIKTQFRFQDLFRFKISKELSD